MLGLGMVDRAERAHLAHAPGMQHLDAEFPVEGLDHRRRRGRAADHGVLHRRELELVGLHVVEQRQPHGRHAGREGDALLLEQLVEAGAVEGHAREHQLRPDQGGRVGQAPGVDVEHRHHRQDHRARRNAQRVGQRRGIGVQQRRAMVIEHALGIARGARGVAKRGSRTFIELRPFVSAGLVRDQLLVDQQVGDLAVLGQMRAVGHGHDMAHRLELRQQLLDRRQEVEVDEEELILGVVDDVDDLLGEEPRVDGVADRAHAGDAVIELEMAVAVPGQGADAVARLDAEGEQGFGHLLRPGSGIAIGVAVDIALDPPRHDLGVAVVQGGVLDELLDQQRAVLHQAEHGRFSRSLGGGDWLFGLGL